MTWVRFKNFLRISTAILLVLFWMAAAMSGAFKTSTDVLLLLFFSMIVVSAWILILFFGVYGLQYSWKAFRGKLDEFPYEFFRKLIKPLLVSLFFSVFFVTSAILFTPLITIIGHISGFFAFFAILGLVVCILFYVVGFIGHFGVFLRNVIVTEKLS